jgi:SpoVK/Ycf46/Vps4 family AAA+-type ATPase
MGINPPRGILLNGKPGCGKTMIAKAVASETNSRFFSVKMSDVIRSEIGESEKFIADLYQRAKEAAPSVVFLDEFQAMFVSRGSGSMSSDSQMTSQLMVEMDLIQSSRCSVVTLAATNVLEAIDPALTRTGRFDVVIQVNPPDFDARLDLVSRLGQRMHFESAMDWRQIAEETEGMTGAEITNLMQKAGLSALHTNPNLEEIPSSHLISVIQSK